jgi:predicted anti-sigma-YlaC factor YlaD
MSKIVTATFLLVAASLTSCAVLRAGEYATEAFMRESDPALAADAMPTMMKAAEALSLADPRSESKALTRASLYVMYANAFLDTEAFLLPEEDYAASRLLSLRAKALYLRASAILVPLVERKEPSIFTGDSGGGSAGGTSSTGFGKKDVPLLYWTAAAILAAFADDPMDFDNAARVAGAITLFELAREMDPPWNGGALHELAITIYGSLPADLGGDRGKARAAFALATGATGSSSPGAFVSYAQAVCVAEGDRNGFRESLEAALSLRPRPESALMDSLARRKAERLLADIDLYF